MVEPAGLSKPLASLNGSAKQLKSRFGWIWATRRESKEEIGWHEPHKEGYEGQIWVPHVGSKVGSTMRDKRHRTQARKDLDMYRSARWRLSCGVQCSLERSQSDASLYLSKSGASLSYSTMGLHFGPHYPPKWTYNSISSPLPRHPIVV